MDSEFIPEREAGIEIVTEQIETWFETERNLNSQRMPILDLREIVRRAYSAGWENGYESAVTKFSGG